MAKTPNTSPSLVGATQYPRIGFRPREMLISFRSEIVASVRSRSARAVEGRFAFGTASGANYYVRANPN
jgi:hypothetical protein